uniref:Uncharacterized protein n=1 Tax=Anopheles atroparvus TaxID=41427 RepID=A0A182IPM7_ANOAO
MAWRDEEVKRQSLKQLIEKRAGQLKKKFEMTNTLTLVGDMYDARRFARSSVCSRVASIVEIAPEDGLPTVVCSSCRDQLESCHRFRRVAHRTQKSLQSYLSYTAELSGSEQMFAAVKSMD